MSKHDCGWDGPGKCPKHLEKPTPEVKVDLMLIPKWCEHFTVGNRYFVKDDLTQIAIDSDWDICPVKGCHAPRPISKSLAQELFEAYQKATNSTWAWEFLPDSIKKGYEAEAKRATEYFERKKC